MPYRCDECGTSEPIYIKTLREYLCIACANRWDEPRVLPTPTLPPHTYRTHPTMPEHATQPDT